MLLAVAGCDYAASQRVLGDDVCENIRMVSELSTNKDLRTRATYLLVREDLYAHATYLLNKDNVRDFTGISVDSLFKEVKRVPFRPRPSYLRGENFEAFAKLSKSDTTTFYFELCMTNSSPTPRHFQKFVVDFYDFTDRFLFHMGGEHDSLEAPPIVLAAGEQKCLPFELPTKSLVDSYWGNTKCVERDCYSNLLPLMVLKPEVLELSAIIPPMPDTKLPSEE